MDETERTTELEAVEARLVAIGRQIRLLVVIEIVIAVVLVLWTLGVAGMLAFLMLG